MPMKSYLKPENSGAQMWQMLRSNLTRGDHPYNFTGFCMALVVQWLLELRFADGQNPEQLGRYLLRANLGGQGYRLMMLSQSSYSTENDTQMIQRHSGEALNLVNLATRHSSQAHWSLIRSKVYKVADDVGKSTVIRLDDRSEPYSGLIGLYGNNNVVLQLILGKSWAHAIGVNSDRNNIYIFDPNYGVFVFDQRYPMKISGFINVMWAQYKANKGDLADVI
jgi:hypothetical protein